MRGGRVGGKREAFVRQSALLLQCILDDMQTRGVDAHAAQYWL